MWHQEFKLVFTAYGAQFEDWGVCATLFRISSPLGIRNDLLYILIISDIKYPFPTTLNMQRRDL